jgi:hypothetical protein
MFLSLVRKSVRLAWQKTKVIIYITLCLCASVVIKLTKPFHQEDTENPVGREIRTLAPHALRNGQKVI